MDNATDSKTGPQTDRELPGKLDYLFQVILTAESAIKQIHVGKAFKGKIDSLKRHLSTKVTLVWYFMS